MIRRYPPQQAQTPLPHTVQLLNSPLPFVRLIPPQIRKTVDVGRVENDRLYFKVKERKKELETLQLSLRDLTKEGTGWLLPLPGGGRFTSKMIAKLREPARFPCKKMPFLCFMHCSTGSRYVSR
jgi:hypothetical protein